MNEIKELEAIAVLIDADNISPTHIKTILDEISTYGRIITKRAYGNWAGKNISTWKSKFIEYSIQPILQIAYTTGKNSTDAAMNIDAMDLLYTKKYDAFVLVSSDSDFTRLALRLRDEGVYVFGVGEMKTPVSLRNACDNFIFIENLESEIAVPKVAEVKPKETTAPETTANKAKKTKKSKKKEPHPTDEVDEVLRLLIIASEKYADEDMWTNLASAGSFLKRTKPDFDPRSYQVKSLVDFVAKYPAVFEVRKMPGKGKTSIIAYKVISQ
ncbi:MAG: NYN domain-containing protein [Sphaerochaetaceae bacterium]|jgi:uncharacterized LabA/DUF88 family protein|nr:NYN domain-containing protein [Sphaerochaetaceae bacterium]